MSLVKKIIIWTSILLVLLIFDRVYFRQKLELKEVENILGKNHLAIRAKRIVLKDNFFGNITFVRTKEYSNEILKTFEDEKRKSNLSNLIKFLPVGFSSFWTLEGREGVPIKEAILSGVLQGILTLKLENPITPEEQEDLSNYGLSDPRNVLLVEFDDNKSIELQVGSKNDDFRITYIKVGEDPNIYPVNESKLEFLKIDPERVHVENIYSYSIASLRQLNIKTRQAEYKIDLSKFDDPIIIEPFKGKASFSAIQKINDELFGLLVEDWTVLNDNSQLKDFNLSDPEISILVKTVDSETSISFTYDKNNKPIGYISNYSSAVFKPSLDPIKRLLNFLTEIRDKKHFRFSIFDVTRFSIDGIQVVQESATKWSRNGQPVSTELVEKLLNKLKELEAINFLEEAPELTQKRNLKIFTNSGNNYDCQFGVSKNLQSIVVCDEIFIVQGPQFNEIILLFEELTKLN